jgi:hypothetical protein
VTIGSKLKEGIEPKNRLQSSLKKKKELGAAQYG